MHDIEDEPAYEKDYQHRNGNAHNQNDPPILAVEKAVVRLQLHGVPPVVLALADDRCLKIFHIFLHGLAGSGKHRVLLRGVLHGGLNALHKPCRRLRRAIRNARNARGR